MPAQMICRYVENKPVLDCVDSVQSDGKIDLPAARAPRSIDRVRLASNCRAGANAYLAAAISSANILA